MNAALGGQNNFGTPLKQEVIQGVPHSQYRFNALNTDRPVYTFSSTVQGQSLPFEIVSSDI